VSLNKTCVVDVHEHLLGRAVPILEEVSYGLDIVLVDIRPVMVQGIPCWAVHYVAKGRLIGQEHYVGQMSVIDTPWMTDMALRGALTEGCNSLRAQRMSQGMNGVQK
jgi:hypothetical protein